MLQCHRRDCQQSSGGSFSSFVIVSADGFNLSQGSLRFHASPGAMGGETHRGFCSQCGSPIVIKPDSAPHLVAIRTASLDDASRCGPQLEVWTSDAQPSDRLNLALPNFETYASATDPATAPEDGTDAPRNSCVPAGAMAAS